MGPEGPSVDVPGGHGTRESLGFGRVRERMWFFKERGGGELQHFSIFLGLCVPNFFVWQIFWRSWGTRTLFRIFHPVFVRGDRMLGVECSLPATVWTEGCRADSGGEGGVPCGATVRGLQMSEYWDHNSLFLSFFCFLGETRTCIPDILSRDGRKGG